MRWESVYNLEADDVETWSLSIALRYACLFLLWDVRSKRVTSNLNKPLPRHQLWVWSGSSGTSLRVHWFQSTCNHFTPSSLSSARCWVVPPLPAHPVRYIYPGYSPLAFNKRHQLQEFCRLPGLQLLFFLCQLLIILRHNCDLAISNLIVRSFADAIAIISGLSSLYMHNLIRIILYHRMHHKAPFTSCTPSVPAPIISRPSL